MSKTVNSGPKMRPARVCDVCHTILVKDATPYFSTELPSTPDWSHSTGYTAGTFNTFSSIISSWCRCKADRTVLSMFHTRLCWVGLEGNMCIALDVMKNPVTFSLVIYIYVELITLWFNLYLTFTYYSLISLPTMPHLPKMLSLQEADTFSEQMFTVSKKTTTRKQGMKLSELNLLKTTTRKQGMKSSQLNLLKTTTRKQGMKSSPLNLLKTTTSKQGMKSSQLNLLLNIESYVRNVWNPLKYKIFEYVQRSVSHIHCLESRYKVYSCVSSSCAI